jgi:hypothetical protein
MKLFGTGNTPFQPANPALDIPDGDPRENTTVTNQSLNNLYGELKLAIEGSGQTLTNVNGTNPNLGQLSGAIGTQSIGGKYYKDIGGSTANVKNIMNSAGYAQEIKVGSIITFHNTVSTDGTGATVTIKVYNKPGELQMSAPLLFQGLPLPIGGANSVFGNNQVSVKSLVTVIRTELGFELMKIASLTGTNNEVITFFTGSKPFTITTVSYDIICSQTGYNYIALPVAYVNIVSINVTPTAYAWSASMRYVLTQATGSGNVIPITCFDGASGAAPALATSAAGSITVMGYTN